MTIGSLAPGDLIFFGVPPLLLLVAAIRSLKSAAHAAGGIFLGALAGWAMHVAFLAQESRQTLHAQTRVEWPDHSSFVSPQMRHLDDRPVLQLQTPGAMTWILRGDERRVRFTYGFIPEAYEKGTTNGAGFSLRLREGGVVRPLFRRVLQPRQQPGDQGPQQARITLPPFEAGAQLELAIDAGEADDASWDWVYLADTGFDRSPHFLPAQFPSYSRVPDRVRAPLAGLILRGETTVSIQLHAPAEMEFLLDGETRHLAFAYGFLPGAYQNGNATDGARFLAELHLPGAEGRVCFERLLQPLTQSADRGPQWANLLLPAHPTGSRLVLKIDAGPAGNNSWDWTYVSRLSLER